MKRAFLILYCFLCCILSSSALSIQEAQSAFNTVDNHGIYVQELTSSNLREFPIGIHKTMGNTPVTLAVSNVVLNYDYTEISAFVKVQLPQQITLYFGAENLKFSHDGVFLGDAKLALLEDVELPAFSDNSLKMIIRGASDSYFKAADLSYVTLSCKGVENFGLAIDLEFSDQFLQPVDKQGEIIHGQKLRTSFKTQVVDLDDLIVGVDLPAFAINGLNGYSFACEKMIFDYSQIKHAGEVVFPQDYTTNFLNNSEIQLWKGFYAERINVTIPTCFKEKDSNKRLSFSAHHLLIDEYGVSGLFTADGQLLSFEKGTASGWDFSVNQFTFQLEANQLIESSFSGEIGIPVSDSTANRLPYQGMFDVYDNYYLSVEVKDDLRFDVLSATATIREESYIKLAVEDNVFRPEALLHGSLTVDIPKEKGSDTSKVYMQGIEFQSMKLQTIVPYFSAEYFGYKGESSMLGIPFYLTELGLSSTETNLDFTCGIGIELGGIVSGTTNMTIRGKNQYINNTFNWSYEKFILNELGIKAEIAETFSLKGSVNLYDNDPVYGNGFGGNISMDFKNVLEGLSIEARALFGCKDNKDYWMADAKAAFPVGIPCGPVTIYGFSGGASSGMRRSAVDSGNLLDMYIPDPNYGLGIKAGVMANFCNSNVISAEATFEILFNKYGGLNFIGLYGNASFLKDIKVGEGISSLKDKATSFMKKVTSKERDITKGNPQLWNKLCLDKAKNPQKTCEQLIDNQESINGMQAKMVLQYDFTNSAFHAQLDMAVNVEHVIYGTGSNYSAGRAVLHIDPNEWYLHVGTPTNPIALAIGIENLISVNASAYFMAGHNIPAAPAPPMQVAELLKTDVDALNYMRDFNALNKGTGVAFGSQFSVDTGDLYFLIAYARFHAGIGFDLMLKDYEQAQCAGREGAVGINGWYANGQTYAYLSGELGVGINLFFIQAKFPIIKGGVATLLQGMLPNPTWLYGQLGLNFDLLGGLVKGSLDFKFEVGEKCQLMRPGQSPLDMEVISEIYPDVAEVDVFAVPQVAFNMPLNKAFEYKRDDKKTYMRIVLDKVELINQDNTSIPGKLTWNDTMDKVSFFSDDVLPPFSTLTFNASIAFEELNNGKWEKVITSGQVSKEERSVSFRTGDAPKNIPLQNIELMYPIKEQQNLYIKESSTGFVQLVRGQDYLFMDNVEYAVEYVKPDSSFVSIPLMYNIGTNRLTFSIPSNLKKQTEYNVRFVAKMDASEDIMGQTTYRNVDSVQGVQIKSNQTDVLANKTDILLLSYKMRTSKYNTFVQKLKSTNFHDTWYDKINSSVYALGYTFKNGEHFDEAEVMGNEFTASMPLVRMTATGTDDYYTNEIAILYKQKSVPIKSTYNNEYGCPPFKAILPNPYYVEDIKNNQLRTDLSVFPWLYEPHVFYVQDWYYVRSILIDKECDGYKLGTTEQKLRNLFPSLYKGKYPVTVQYVLPGGEISSTTEFIFENNY